MITPFECSQFELAGGCECRDGFTLDYNRKDCTRSLGVIDEGLSVVKDGRFCYALTDVAFGNNRTFRCSDDLLNVISIEFEKERKKIMYLQENNNTFEIGVMELGLWTREILYTSQTAIKGFSCVVNENMEGIYFASNDSIMRYNFIETDVIHKEKNVILSIAVASGRIAWVTAENYFIKISDLDGSRKRTLVKALGIRNIFFSPHMKRLFWTSYEGIMSIDKDGRNQQVNRYTPGATVDSLLHYQNLLIWSMSTAKENFICSSEYGNGAGAKQRCVLLEGKITDIVINDRLLSSEDSSSFCSTGCQQMCLKYPKYKRYRGREEKCGCEFGFRERDNNCIRVLWGMGVYLLIGIAAM
ncbi:uncharacterized protein LOC134263798 [Saccostrea cucullata]|uniref:uncharacterized protein LOC134263798 n=1 Tax=Saccostrea cuccullata TaxID=36930 RepID=UPI002ED2A134